MLDPCRTPARTSLPDECWPFRTSLCFHDFKKSVKILKGDPPVDARSQKKALKWSA